MPAGAEFQESDDGSLSLSIRYEGGDADGHTIDLHQLGQSLQGMARILAVSAHFTETGKYNKQFDTLSVKVVAEPVDKHHCYEVTATILQVATSGALWSGLGTALLMAVLGYVFNRRKAEEMKHLSDALKQSISQQAEVQERMLLTIEKLADSLQPSVRQALAPIGQSVESINLRRRGAPNERVVLDRETKELAQVGKNHAITGPHHMSGIISELDMVSGSCKVSLESDPDNRVPAKIVDPVVSMPNNPYAQALSQISTIAFTAKAEIDADGCVVTLYISDCQL
ncbi:MAG: hypothetical protein KER_03054 [Kerstersia gyiorum]|uniref:DUF7946 domain-containing protein n=1 Tax=Kerstersia gyiorum TaxID=206506 RepID=UPI0030D0E95F